jgi:uncharacterized protein involved in response to NO
MEAMHEQSATKVTTPPPAHVNESTRAAGVGRFGTWGSGHSFFWRVSSQRFQSPMGRPICRMADAGLSSGPLWHAHEMLYGFTMAVVTGFLFTAVRNLTSGRRRPADG